MAPDDAARRHRRVAEYGRAASKRHPARPDHIGGIGEILKNIGHAAGVDEAQCQAGDIPLQAIDRYLAPDRLEG